MNNQEIDLFYQAEDYFFNSICKMSIDFGAEATAYYTGVATPSLNLVYIRKQTDDFESILAHCEEFYQINQSSWNVIVNEHCVSSVIEHLLQINGFQYNEKSVAMYLELSIDNQYSFENKGNIKLVNDKLEQWLKPLIEAFESTYEICRHYANVHEEALRGKAKLYHYSLFNNEEPVSSLTLSLQNNLARIDDVGTLPAYQRKGYATLLMKHAINQAIDMGASCCFLEASEVGLSLYQKMGFKSLFRNHIYSQPE